MRTAKTLLLTIFAFMVAACSDDSQPSQDMGVSGDGQTLSDITSQADTASPDIGIDATPDASVAAGKATTIKFHMHDNEVTLVLSTMTVGGKEAPSWDLYMAHDNGPNTYLGQGVTALNLGAAKSFHEVEEAPESGYQADGKTLDSLVIGTSWRSGGSGTTGYIMTNNIYVLKLADGTYGKIQVLSAKSGEIPLLVYHQADGSRNLKTEE